MTASTSEEEEEDEEDRRLWEQQRVFGARLKRKTIEFLPAAVAPTQAIHPDPRTTASISPGDRYLQIVLKNGPFTEDRISTMAEAHNRERIGTQQLEQKGAFCGVCNLPIYAPSDATLTAFANHESSIAHMVCLTHSLPPSHLDHSRQGLKYLLSYGWDPDSRQGLGATGEGIRAPIKAKVKNDTAGLGGKMKTNKKSPDAKVERIDAKQARKKDLEDRRKRERLQEIFYRNDDVEKYLGGGMMSKDLHACPKQGFASEAIAAPSGANTACFGSFFSCESKSPFAFLAGY